MPINGTLLTFDFAASTGYAVGLAGSMPTFGTHVFPSTGTDLGTHLGQIEEFCRAAIIREKPVLVGFEQPSLFIKTTPTTVVKLACYGPALEKQCSRRYGLNVRVRQINPSDVCMFWCGRGMKGQAKKEEFVRIAKMLGFAVSNDDEADAIACWFFMVHCFGSPEEKMRFEQMRFEVGMGRAQKAVL